MSQDDRYKFAPGTRWLPKVGGPDLAREVVSRDTNTVRYRKLSDPTRIRRCHRKRFAEWAGEPVTFELGAP